MKILVTGSQGYIGTVLCQILKEKKYNVVGYDVGYYKDNVLIPHYEEIFTISKDIRDVVEQDLEGFDVVIHLAALSNDPLGEFSPRLTREINLDATLNLAKIAKKARVSRFIFSSSQSMYGISKNDNELDEINSEKKPVTEYAKTKWEAELAINKLSCKNFSVTCLRPSTVFGASNRLRCDIVFNNLVACAFTTGKIEIKSDGSPWRPVVHVKDVCSAFISIIEAPLKYVQGKAFNVGIKNGNYTVRDLAIAAQKVVKGSELVFTNEHNDPRTYKVSFNRIFDSLSDYYKPSWDLIKGGQELVSLFKKIKFEEKDFRSKKTIRLKQLIFLKENRFLDDLLRLNRE